MSKHYESQTLPYRTVKNHITREQKFILTPGTARIYLNLKEKFKKNNFAPLEIKDKRIHTIISITPILRNEDGPKKTLVESYVVAIHPEGGTVTCQTLLETAGVIENAEEIYKKCEETARWLETYWDAHLSSSSRNELILGINLYQTYGDNLETTACKLDLKNREIPEKTAQHLVALAKHWEVYKNGIQQFEGRIPNIHEEFRLKSKQTKSAALRGDA